MDTFVYRCYGNEHGWSVPIPYCSENELMGFANKLRLAGHADPISAFMPSTVGSSNSCLIANALNFSGSVSPYRRLVTGEYEFWYLELPWNIDPDVLNRLIQVTGHGTFDARNSYRLRLPRLIGNAAHAFDDASDGWTIRYRKTT